MFGNAGTQRQNNKDAVTIF